MSKTRTKINLKKVKKINRVRIKKSALKLPLYKKKYSIFERESREFYKRFLHFGKAIDEFVFRTLKNLRFWKLILSILAFLFVLILLFYILIFRTLPSPRKLADVQSPQTTIIRDRHGEVLYKVYKDANRTTLNWNEIPQNVKDATLAIEDADFYHHFGVSPKSIIRAFMNNMKQKDINLYQGGSTITQQLVKNKLLGSEKTYLRKFKEVLLSFWTERLFSKDQIFNMYLNEVGYGGPAYGIQTASETYFGIPASSLTLAQAAFLAGLPAAPTAFSPFGSNPEMAYMRQKEVITRMVKLNMISDNQAKEAFAEKINFAPQRINIKAPHFVMFVKEQIAQQLGEEKLTEGGLDVITTLDYQIQKYAEEVVNRQITEIKDRYNIHNAGVLITNPKTGEILAMVGSVNYFDIDNKGYVNVTTALRQPGSSIKPVNYAYAFDHGFTPGSTIEDSPVKYVAGTESYSPQNYDGKYHGTVTLRSALANSYNVPAVKILNSYGFTHMIDLGRKMGIKTWDTTPTAGLSITLGGAEVTMLDMARAYGTIANLGIKQELKAINDIKTNQNKVISSIIPEAIDKSANTDTVYAAENEQVISPLSAYWLTDILSDNIARLPAFGPYAKLTVPNYKVAVKTGTSNNFRDNWTIGYTPDYLVAVWVGNNDGSFMNKNLTSGITGAAPIWNEIMTNLLKNTKPKEFAIPSGLIPVRICAVNGLLTCPNCPEEKTEYFTANKIPTQKCFIRPTGECDEARKQAEGKSEEEKKTLLSGCLNAITPVKQ